MSRADGNIERDADRGDGDRHGAEWIANGAAGDCSNRIGDAGQWCGCWGAGGVGIKLDV
jgi:hypothetical protein